MLEQEIKCEFGDCKHIAKVRMIKKESIRVFTLLNDFSLSKVDIKKEKFACILCAQFAIKEGWEIIQWIREKIPEEILFGIKHDSWQKYQEEKDISHWELSYEKSLRWAEQKYCLVCGGILTHETRKYVDNDGYDSPNRWVNLHNIIKCTNCGFFDYDYKYGEESYIRSKSEEYGYNSPEYDSDYKAWKKSLKDIKEREENRNE